MTITERDLAPDDDYETGPVVQICAPRHVAATSKALGLPVVSDDLDDPYHHAKCGGCGGEKTDDDCPYAVRIRRYVDSMPYPPSSQVPHGMPAIS